MGTPKHPASVNVRTARRLCHVIGQSQRQSTLAGMKRNVAGAANYWAGDLQISGADMRTNYEIWLKSSTRFRTVEWLTKQIKQKFYTAQQFSRRDN